MNVQAAQAGQVKHPLRQDQTVGGHDHHVDLRCDQFGLGLLRVFGVFAVQTQAARLGHGHPVRLRKRLDWRGVELHATTGGAVGLGQHQGHFETRCVQVCQRDLREFGRARESDPQAVSHSTHRVFF